ncbi:hypothetical protein GCM10028805_36730 [Spirosoma harenae]
MSKATETMRNLTEASMGHLSWPLIEWLSKSKEVVPLKPSVPYYKMAIELYNEQYPNAIATKWQKLRGGYRIAYAAFEAEFNEKVETLLADKENRIAYIKRRVDELYMGEMKFDSLTKWGNYIISDSFKELKAKIDIELWDELDMSGAAAHQAATYGLAISNMMERALQLDGVPLKNGLGRLEKIVDVVTEEFLQMEGKPITTQGDTISNHKPLNGKLYQNSFKELFISPDEVLESINILREITRRNKKPVIDDVGKWIGGRGSMSILIAWVEVLQERGKFKATIPPSKMAELLNDHFPGLKLDTTDASIWRKITTIRNKYHATFFQYIK